jgi:ketosteroid isomerase-like protein
LKEYERKANSRRFEEVAPLISDDAIFWFNDGSFRGIDAIKEAFENTWSLDIQDDQYYLDNVEWVIEEDTVAVCTYLYHWRGKVNGQQKNLGDGRGTSVMKKEKDWKIVHEHLSRIP